MSWSGLVFRPCPFTNNPRCLALLLPHLPRWGFSRVSTMTADEAGCEICWPNATMIIIILRRRRMRMRTRTKNEGEHGPHASLWLATRPEPVIVHVQVVFVSSHFKDFISASFVCMLVSGLFFFVYLICSIPLPVKPLVSWNFNWIGMSWYRSGVNCSLVNGSIQISAIEIHYIGTCA